MSHLYANTLKVLAIGLIAIFCINGNSNALLTAIIASLWAIEDKIGR